MARTDITITVPGSKPGTSYEIKEASDGSWYCSCPAWKNQKLPAEWRECKHMTQAILAVVNLGNHVVGATEAAKRCTGAVAG